MTSTSILQPAVGIGRPRRSQGSERNRRDAKRSVSLGRGNLARRRSQGSEGIRRDAKWSVSLGRGNLARRRAQLEARWRDRLERVTSISIAYHEAAQGLPACLDGVRTVASRRAKQLARQAVAERQALAEIEAALDRIAAGTYGCCEQCGQAICAALLAARPHARYCGACEQAPDQQIA